MKELTIQSQMKVYESSDELTSQDRELLSIAINQLDKAYAPYSNFLVGAALRLEDDSVYVGCNQENASYPLGICGERVALFNAGSNKPNIKIRTLAIVAQNLKSPIEKPVTPCGACRQVISEFEYRHSQSIRILLKGDSKEIYEVESIKALLPFSFDGSFLG